MTVSSGTMIYLLQRLSAQDAEFRAICLYQLITLRQEEINMNIMRERLSIMP